MKIGIIARDDNTGLGYQTRNLTYMLKPDAIMVINSENHFGYRQNRWYSEFNHFYTKQLIPTMAEYRQFLQACDAFITCETPYNWHLVAMANNMMKKSYLQYNYEFFEYFQNNRLPMFTKFLAPSYWHTDELKKIYSDRLTYLPPPIDISEYKENRQINANRSGMKRFVHIVGKEAVHDRNGTQIVLDALKHIKHDFELVIYSQNEIETIDDRRVTYNFNNVPSNIELYKDFDALILPRRYGGLCMPMIEALASGLPVIMTSISPNTKVLPKKWLTIARKDSEFFARTNIDIYSTKPEYLAGRIKWLCELSDDELQNEKVEAFEIANENYSFAKLRPQYEALWLQ